MLLRRKKWSMRLTAKSLDVSIGTVSEAVKLAKAILEDSSLESLSREDALARIK